MADGIRVPDKGALSTADKFLGVDSTGTTGLLAEGALAAQLKVPGKIVPILYFDPIALSVASEASSHVGARASSPRLKTLRRGSRAPRMALRCREGDGGEGG